MSYTDYLLKVAKVDQAVPLVRAAHRRGKLLRRRGCDSGSVCRARIRLSRILGLEPPAVAQWIAGRSAGRKARPPESGRVSVHFPDGNATIARLLVRWLIPDAVPGTTMESVGMAQSQLSVCWIARTRQRASA